MARLTIKPPLKKKKEKQFGTLLLRFWFTDSTRKNWALCFSVILFSRLALVSFLTRHTQLSCHSNTHPKRGGKKRQCLYVSVFGFHVVVTPPTFRRTTPTRRSRSPSPPCIHVAPATDEYMGVDWWLAEGKKKKFTALYLSDSSPTPRLVYDWAVFSPVSVSELVGPLWRGQPM